MELSFLQRESISKKNAICILQVYEITTNFEVVKLG